MFLGFRSPDLMPLDFFILGCVKSVVCASTGHLDSMTEFKHQITTVFATVMPKMMCHVWDERDY
jgi:hypothetical protein